MAEFDQTTKAEVFFNPACSKCRTVEGYLAERGIDAEFVEYLKTPPTREDLDQLMRLLGIEDPREMMRPDEEAWGRLGLEEASAEERLQAITQEPVLLQRPIVVVGDRAVIARPAERALELFGAEPPE